jgi:hypothetical protein
MAAGGIIGSDNIIIIQMRAAERENIFKSFIYSLQTCFAPVSMAVGGFMQFYIGNHFAGFAD